MLEQAILDDVASHLSVKALVRDKHLCVISVPGEEWEIRDGQPKYRIEIIYDSKKKFKIIADVFSSDGHLVLDRRGFGATERFAMSDPNCIMKLTEALAYDFSH